MSVKRTAAKKVSRSPAESAVPVAVCVVPGCERPVLHRGLCPAHWESPQRELADDN